MNRKTHCRQSLGDLEEAVEYKSRFPELLHVSLKRKMFFNFLNVTE